MGVYIYESESIAIRNGKISEYRLEHRNAMSEHKTGTGTRIRTGTETGTKALDRNIEGGIGDTRV